MPTNQPGRIGTMPLRQHARGPGRLRPERPHASRDDHRARPSGARSGLAELRLYPPGRHVQLPGQARPDDGAERYNHRPHGDGRDRLRGRCRAGDGRSASPPCSTTCSPSRGTSTSVRRMSIPASTPHREDRWEGRDPSGGTADLRVPQDRDGIPAVPLAPLLLDPFRGGPARPAPGRRGRRSGQA